MIPVLYPWLDGSDLLAFLGLTKKAGDELETVLKAFFGFAYVSTFSTGRAGLFNILKAHQLVGKDVLVPAYTCCVVAEAIVQSGNRPVFLDAAEGSLNASITPDDIARHGSNLGAVIITNLYGITDFSCPAFLDDHQRRFLVIVDDALSPGHIADASRVPYDYITISCGVRKPFTCLGGGVVLTNNHARHVVLQQYVQQTTEGSAQSGRCAIRAVCRVLPGIPQVAVSADIISSPEDAAAGAAFRVQGERHPCRASGIP